MLSNLAIYIIAAIALFLCIVGLVCLLISQNNNSEPKANDSNSQTPIIIQNILPQQESDEDDEDNDIEVLETKNDEVSGNTIKLLLVKKRKLEARICQSTDDIKERYQQIVSKLLNIKETKGRLSKSYDKYKFHDQVIAKLALKGNLISVFLPLETKEYVNTKYSFKDVSDIKKHENTPFLYKVSGPRTLMWVLELIDDVILKYNLKTDKNLTEINIKEMYPNLPYKTLLEKGLIIETKYEETLDPNGKRISLIKK